MEVTSFKRMIGDKVQIAFAAKIEIDFDKLVSYIYNKFNSISVKNDKAESQ